MEFFSSLSQYSDIGLLVLRLGVGIIFVYHAWPKLSQSEEMANMMGWSPVMVATLGVVELLAGLGVALGLFVRLLSLILGIIMIGAILFKAGKMGTPFSSHETTGWEIDLILLAANCALFFIGAGSIVL